MRPLRLSRQHLKAAALGSGGLHVHVYFIEGQGAPFEGDLYARLYVSV